MDLFTPVVHESKQHPNFKNLIQFRDGFAMDVLNDWARGFVDRGGKFVEQFQTTFNSSFSELYVFAMLKAYGMRVDFQHARPDFCVPSLNLTIEAIIASDASGATAEHASLDGPPPDLNEFNRVTIIRLANAIAAKHRKYLKSYSTLSHVKNRSHVIAVKNFDQPFSFIAVQRPIEALLYGYYVDEERHIATDGKARLEGEELLIVAKDNGSPIELDIFTSPAYKEISAVIFSTCATMGKVRALSSDPNPGIFFIARRLNGASNQPHVIRKPKEAYEENLLDGLRIYHNPYAEHPLDPALFRHPGVFQWYFEDGDARVDQHDGQLLFRCVFRTLNREAVGTARV